MENPRERAGDDTGPGDPSPLEALARRLRQSLAAGLPGRRAQVRMAPRSPDGESLHGDREPPASALPAAGLAILYARAGEPHLLLTVRSSDLPAHPGQVGLPGGMRDPGETLLGTALREAREEVGVSPEEVRLLGSLTSIYIPPTRIELHPFLAVARGVLAFRPQAAEVARLLEVPVRALLDPATVRTERRRLAAGEAVIPYYAFDGEKIWGATAMILAELEALLSADEQV